MKLSDFHYDLPKELIAQYPLPERSASRLLCLDGHTGIIQHKQFTDIVDLIDAKDIVIFNNTRVLQARLKAQKETGGHVEILVERIIDAHTFLAHTRASKALRLGMPLLLVSDPTIRFIVGERENNLVRLTLPSSQDIQHIIETFGEIPLPPYMQRAPEKQDLERYQTVYSAHIGSVAAPTAGLHFDEPLLAKCRQKGIEFGFVTLHVGAGTFAPVRSDNVQEHVMHSEYFRLTQTTCDQIKSAKARGGRVIAVGTTSARSLETASLQGEVQPYAGETSIFIYPGFQFRCVDVLITNFHVPESTLLMLVSAFAGFEFIQKAYQEAITQKYRFFSYGDAMFIIGAQA
jgi:S-adenosylmethionine:tRNA ribosyltransferase-isomerase